MTQKNYLFGVGILLFITTLSFLLWPKQHKELEVVHSGAYESLTFLAAARSFPNPELPEEGYYKAFKSMQQNTAGLQAKVQTEPWESLGPHNRAGRMISIAVNPQNPQTIYAGSASGGLWKSYTRGAGVAAWQRVETGFPALAISTIAFAPGDSTTLYIGTGEVYNVYAAGTGAAYRSTRGSFGIGILKSTDGGNTWRFSLDWTSRQTQGIWDIKIFPSNPNLLWATTTDGTYKSTDAGETWIKIHNVLMGTSLLVHPDDPNKLVVAYGNFSTPGFGIYTTTNGGQSWTKKGNPLPAAFNGKIQLAMSPSQPNTIYASIGNGFGFNDGASWLCRSDDFGNTWSVKSTTDYSQWQGWYSHDVAVHPTNPDEIMVIGIDVWKSTNGGETLIQKSLGGIGENNPEIGSTGLEPTFVHSDCHVVLYDPESPNYIYIGDDGGIHRSEDGGNTFKVANARLQTTQYYNGFSNSVQDSTLSLGGLQDNGSNISTADKRWGVIFGGDGGWSAIHPENDRTLFVSSQNLNILRSKDGGTFFGNISPPLSSESAAFIAPFVITPTQFDDNVILYAGATRVYRSIDSGENWEATNGNNPLDGNVVLSMAVDQKDPFVVYAATAPTNTTPSGVYVTLDGGQFWSDITQNLPKAYPMDIAMDPTDNSRAYVVYSGFGNAHAFRTDDYGENWIDISTALPDVPTNAILADPLFPSNLYLGNDLGVFASTDYGDTWSTYQEGLPAAIMVFDLTISPSNRKLRIASHGNGVYQRDLLEVDNTVASKDLPTPIFEVNLWPNPASDWLQIAIEQSEEAAEVLLMDAVGRVQKTQKGKGLIQIQVADLPSGIYFCQIRIGQKMMLRKIEVFR